MADMVLVRARGRWVPAVAQGPLEHRRRDDDHHHDRQLASEVRDPFPFPGVHRKGGRSVQEFGADAVVVERNPDVDGVVENQEEVIDDENRWRRARRQPLHGTDGSQDRERREREQFPLWEREQFPLNPFAVVTVPSSAPRSISSSAQRPRRHLPFGKRS
ncbi:unnamed protein product [Miscanthus lutarioriparius]|uniref:Uncharacterized protein n=1 Tax=Miscanthus lutarioriparius TaxID=422564 RepID=A0A811NMS7_9POAL|nr:unnamed protein product [Miscanthus lutarioriparius]